MEGRGVQNYAVNRPTHAITSKTTEFDDELVKRGIVTYEQVMGAKGASRDEAIRLAQERVGNYDDGDVDVSQTNAKDETGDDANSEGCAEDDEDDGFMAQYRQKRLDELKQQQQKDSNNNNFCSVRHISREEWTESVNEDSNRHWVLVTLIDRENQERVQQELHNLEQKVKTTVYFVTIFAQEAIPNWPAARTPSIFGYRHGIKHHEWIANSNGEFPPGEVLERMIESWDAECVD